MRELKYILVFCLLSFSATVFCLVQAQDYERLGERELSGTARYVGMGGAMTAIGGDPSAVQDNPAGLGVYQRAEVMLTTDFRRTSNRQQSADPYSLRQVTVPQISVVIALPNYDYTSKIVSNNLMFSYNRLKLFTRDLSIRGNGGPSLGALINDVELAYFVETGKPILNIDYPTDAKNVADRFRLVESGYVNNFSVDWAMNIDNRWYVGLGLRVQNSRFSSDGDYYEYFSTINPDGGVYDLQNKTSLIYSGVGFNAAVGLIYRPCQWARVGVSLQSPTVGRLNSYSSGTLSSLTDTLRYSYSPELRTSTRSYHAPLQLSVSAAAQIGQWGLIALQYNYRHGMEFQDLHSLRAGIEVVPILGLYINAGYVFESTFKPADGIVPIDPTLDRQDAYFTHMRHSQYISGAVGYRGQHMIFQLAYQYNWQVMNLFKHQNAPADRIDTDIHKVVFSIAWHRAWP